MALGKIAGWVKWHWVKWSWVNCHVTELRYVPILIMVFFPECQNSESNVSILLRKDWLSKRLITKLYRNNILEWFMLSQHALLLDFFISYIDDLYDFPITIERRYKKFKIKECFESNYNFNLIMNSRLFSCNNHKSVLCDGSIRK